MATKYRPIVRVHQTTSKSGGRGVAVAYLGLRWSPCNCGSDRSCNGLGCTGVAGDATAPAATAPPPATRVRPPRSRLPRPPARHPSPPPVASSPLQRYAGCGLRWANLFFFWQVTVRLTDCTLPGMGSRSPSAALGRSSRPAAISSSILRNSIICFSFFSCSFCLMSSMLVVLL